MRTSESHLKYLLPSVTTLFAFSFFHILHSRLVCDSTCAFLFLTLFLWLSSCFSIITHNPPPYSLDNHSTQLLVKERKREGVKLRVNNASHGNMLVILTQAVCSTSLSRSHTVERWESRLTEAALERGLNEWGMRCEGMKERTGTLYCCQSSTMSKRQC